MNKLAGISLAQGRMHELSGMSALPFALLMSSGQTMLCGPPGWTGSVHPEGLTGFAHAKTMIHVPCPIKADALWSAETALRAGALDSVMLWTYETPGLTELRRLQLAAEVGNTLGLLLVQCPSRSSAAETRWHCMPHYARDPDHIAIHVSLYKNKRGLLGSWMLHAQRNADIITVDATPAGEPVWPDRVAG